MLKPSKLPRRDHLDCRTQDLDKLLLSRTATRIMAPSVTAPTILSPSSITFPTISNIASSLAVDAPTFNGYDHIHWVSLLRGELLRCLARDIHVSFIHETLFISKSYFLETKF